MPTPNRLELRQRIYIQSRAQRIALWAAGALMMSTVVAILVLVVYLAARAGKDPAAVLQSMLDRFASKPWDTALHLLLLVAIVLQVIYLRRAQQHERLILTPAGIEYRSPLPAALQALRPGWSLAWGQIRSATLKSILYGRGPQTVQLELDGGTRKVKLFPWQWVDPQHHQPVSPWQQARQWQRATPEAVSAAIHDSAILRYLAAALPHLAPQPGARLASASFALEKNPSSLAVVIAFFVLLLYALADTFVLGHETYTDAPPVSAFVAAGVLATVAAALWMLRARVPTAEGMVVALLFGAAFGAAGYPGALRINAITDGEGLHKYQYRLTPERQLEPLTAGLPTLAFPKYYEYWEQFQPGSHHEFELRKGGLGFYQLNMQPVNAVLRRFYETRNTP
jgi:hypothetical protein